ncbi:hypothetical protein E2F50_18500 [Rhizobium deserti]|uniref:Uncharacterized protein n=1 Tax=Rhizobium deserti TaxID=2547961 RepID=A0A4R5UB78_9HYPH|nr:hypothetical protein E2F50_18500 [Rhizobium deserti]
MKKVEDLISSAKAVHERYATGRMDREIVRQWILGLGGYPEPYGSRIKESAVWFKSGHNEMDPTELKVTDLASLEGIYRA